MSFLSLRLLPISEEQHVHHLLYVSGVVIFETDKKLLDRELLLVNHNQRFAIPDQTVQTGTVPNELKEISPVIVFDLSDIEHKADLLKSLLLNNQEVQILLGSLPSQDQLSVLEDLHEFSKNLKILVLENKNSPMDEILSVLPSWLRAGTYFVYLPKRNSADCLFNPQEVVERMQFRTLQCQEQNEQFHLASFGAGLIVDPLLRSFYEEPSLSIFLAITEKKNYFRYILLKLIRATGLAGVLGFIFWFLKVVLNPRGYNILQDVRGWLSRFFGWMFGILIDIKGLCVASAVKAFWWCRSLVGQSWQLRVAAQSIVGQRWRLKVFLQKLISERWRVWVSIQRIFSESWKLKVYLMRLFSESWKFRVLLLRIFSERWRLKVFLQQLISNRWRVKVYLLNLYSQRWKLKVYLSDPINSPWKVKVFFLRIFSQSWRVRVFFQNLWSQTWRVRVFLIRTKWRIIGFFGMLNRLLGFLRHYLMSSVLIPAWKILSFPFKKIYWFLEYQYKKRILKNIEVDDGK